MIDGKDGAADTAQQRRPGSEASALNLCWRRVQADHAAVLIDADDYFRAARRLMLEARRRIIIVGWDVHTRTDLAPGGVDDDLPTHLDPFLHALLESRPELEVQVLCWDFAMIYALERDWAPVLKPDWLGHERLHFEMDGCHPLGASQHQKLLIIDDALACCGGMDLSKWRWDTREHKADQPLRLDPEGKPYPPFHDLQMVVDGEAARALAELAHQRWLRATGQSLAPLALDTPWPEWMDAGFRDVELGIARTLPEHEEQSEVREIEAVLQRIIGAARDAIYIENQYLTSDAVARWLCESLAAEQGPEIVIVLPRETGAWLEQQTMDVLRSRILKRLRAADHGGRLRVHYPELPGLEQGCLSVHSKLMLVDDRFLFLGSANLSNRSMGFDSECNLLLDAAGDDRLAAAIRHLRNDLLAEHMGTDLRTVARACEAQGLIGGIRACNDGGRHLADLDGELDAELERQLPDSRYIDPEQTVQPDRLVEQFMNKPSREPARRRLVGGLLLVVGVLLLAAAWRWTPLSEWLDPHLIRAWMESLQPGLPAGLLVLAVFVLASLVSFPVTLLVVALALSLPAGWAFVYAMLGAMASSAVSYAIGAWLGRDAVRRWAGKRINRVSRRVAKRGVLAVAFLRIVPLAPFTVVNLVAGASHVRARDFLLGSLLGLIPGIGALTLFVDGIVAAVGEASPTNLALLGLGALALGGLWWLRRHIAGGAAGSAGDRED